MYDYSPPPAPRRRSDLHNDEEAVSGRLEGIRSEGDCERIDRMGEVYHYGSQFKPINEKEKERVELDTELKVMQNKNN